MRNIRKEIKKMQEKTIYEIFMEDAELRKQMESSPSEIEIIKEIGKEIFGSLALAMHKCK